MKRRDFVKGVGLASAAAAATSTFPKPAISRGAMEWHMVTAWPDGLPGLGTGAERLAQRIGRMSDGRLTVKVHAGGELVPALQCFDAVASGTVEMGHDAAFYHLGKSRAFAYFSAVPFGLTGNEMSAWLEFGGGQELWDELSAPFDLKPFMAGTTGTQMLGWFRHELKSVEDLKGLKMRMPGLGGDVLRKLGTTVVLLPAGELFPSLQSGAIDAAEFVGPYNDLSLGLHQVAKYYYSPGFQDSGTALQCIVNKTKFDGLPDDLKEVIRVACRAATEEMWGEYTLRSGEALRTLRTKHGVQVMRAPRDMMIAIGNAAGEVMTEERDNADPITRRVFDSYLRARHHMLDYTFIAEQAYLNARALPYSYPEV